MDAKRQMMEKSSNNSSENDECRIQEKAIRNNDTILMDEVVMVSPTSLTTTHADIEDTKVLESTDVFHTFAKNDIDVNFSSVS